MTTSKKEVRPFGARDRFGYLFGDFANDFTFVLSSTVLMKFYTDVMGVSALVIGVLMMAARIFDAFTDVIMGQICDRSKETPQGKFRPWIKRMAGPVCVASFLIYAPYFADKPMAFKIIWMFVTYLLWGSVFYTSINIPYGSMASALSESPKDRQSLSTFRTVGSILASMIVAIVLPLFCYYKDAAGNQMISGTKTMIFAGACSVAAFVLYMLCYGLTTERVHIAKNSEKFSLKVLLKTVFGDKSVITIIICSLLLLLAQLTSAAMSNFIYPNYFGNAKIMAGASMAGIATTFIIAPFIGKLSTKFGRKQVAFVGAVIAAASMLAAFIMHTHNVGLWIMFTVIMNAGMGMINLVIWAMITDVIDDNEVRTGVRSDGAIYSVYSFARKLGQAASSGLSGWLLTAAGYTAATAFDTGVVNSIYNLTCLIPMAGFAILALVLFFLYPLNKERVEANVAALKEKHGDKENA